MSDREGTQSVGVSVGRVDGAAKVTGIARYVDDIPKMEGELVGLGLRLRLGVDAHHVLRARGPDEAAALREALHEGVERRLQRGGRGGARLVLRALDDGAVHDGQLGLARGQVGVQAVPVLKLPAAHAEHRLDEEHVRDRVAQEVLRRLLELIFEPLFHDDSYGFRPGRGCHQAVARVLEYHEQGDKVVLDADISGFFDNIPFDVIMNALKDEVADGNILRLVEKFLRAGVMENGVFKPTNVGTPQGGVFSPLLAT